MILGYFRVTWVIIAIIMVNIAILIGYWADINGLLGGLYIDCRRFCVVLIYCCVMFNNRITLNYINVYYCVIFYYFIYSLSLPLHSLCIHFEESSYIVRNS